MASQSEQLRRRRRRRRRDRPRRRVARGRSAALRTVVLDAGEAGAWRVAAGMLAPVTEAEFGERALLELGLRSARGVPRRSAPSWPRPRARSRAAGDRHAGRRARPRRGRGARAAARVPARARACASSGCGRARRAALEPALAPTVRLALDVPGDHAVDPRRLVAALRPVAFERAGGELRRVSWSTGPTRDGSTPRRRCGRSRRAACVAGCGAARIGLPDDARVPVRPVKGQILRLRDPRGAGPGRRARSARASALPRPARRRPLRARRDDGGARLRHRADRRRRLRAAARPRARSCPACSSSRSRSCARGPAPGTPDNLPAIGPGALDGPRVGDRPLPQRDPARAAHRRGWSPRSLAGEPLPGLGRRAPIRAAVRRGRSHEGGPQRRARRARRRRHGAAAVDGARPAGAGRGVAVAVDAEVVPRGEWAQTRAERRARGSRSCARSREAEMASDDPSTTRSTIGGRELQSRLLLGTGGFRSLDALAAAHRGVRHRARHRRAAPHRPGRARLDRRRARPRRRPAAAQHRRLLHGARRGAHRQARARGVRDRLGQARGDRRRAHAAARRAGAARGGRGARRRGLHRAPVHERRPDPRPPAGGRRLRGGDAARLADRLRHGPAQPVQPAPDPRARAACR